MSRWVLALAILSMTAGAARGQDEAGAPGTSPFDFSFGPQENGHFGAIVKGDRFYTLSRITPDAWDPRRRYLISPFAGLEVDGGWSSAPDALNNASVSFKPAFGLSRIGRRVILNPVTEEPDTVPTTAGPWLHVYGDLRQRYGRFQSEAGATPEPVNQTMLGVGAQLRWTGFATAYANLLSALGLDTGREDQPPSLSLTYYNVRSTSTDLPQLPAGITADALQSTLRSDITLPILCTRQRNRPPPSPDDPFGEGTLIDCPLGLTGELTSSWARGARAGLFGDVGVYMNTGSALKPIIRYRSGEEHGLRYDRQLLLGVIWDLAR